jgi:predicted HTH transcriptional regulator
LAPDVLAKNNRSVAEQLSALRLPRGIHILKNPTVLGIVVVGKDVIGYVAGAYIKFRRIEGAELDDAIRDQKEISGPLAGSQRE